MQLIAKILAFYFLMGSLLPRTDFGQLQTLSNLIEHYQLHLQEAALTGEAFTLKDFIWDHFINPDKHQHPDGNDVHHKLPFHSLNAFSSFIPASAVVLSIKLPLIFSETLTAVAGLSLLEICFSIFRPPVL